MWTMLQLAIVTPSGGKLWPFCSQKTRAPPWRNQFDQKWLLDGTQLVPETASQDFHLIHRNIWPPLLANHAAYLRMAFIYTSGNKHLNPIDHRFVQTSTKFDVALCFSELSCGFAAQISEHLPGKAFFVIPGVVIEKRGKIRIWKTPIAIGWSTIL